MLEYLPKMVVVYLLKMVVVWLRRAGVSFLDHVTWSLQSVFVSSACYVLAGTDTYSERPRGTHGHKVSRRQTTDTHRDMTIIF